MENKLTLTIEKVKHGIYQVGYYPALAFLKEQEDEENYKNCEIIKKALDQVGKGREWYLSSKVDENSLKSTYEKIMQSRKNPTILNSNMPYYIEKFKDIMKT